MKSRGGIAKRKTNPSPPVEKIRAPPTLLDLTLDRRDTGAISEWRTAAISSEAVQRGAGAREETTNEEVRRGHKYEQNGTRAINSNHHTYKQTNRKKVATRRESSPTLPPTDNQMIV